MLTITLDIGGFTLHKGSEDTQRCATYFPTRRYTFAVKSIIPFITVHRLAADAYRLEHGPFLRAYDALTTAQTLRRSIRYVDSKAV